MKLISTHKTMAIMAFGIALLSPLSVRAAASARAFVADERVFGQVQPPYVTGPVTATSQVGISTDPGYAYAFSDLNTGILRVVGKSVYAPPYTTTADASAAFTDSVTFFGGNGMTAYLDYWFDGSLGVVEDSIPKSAFAQMYVNISTVATSTYGYETLSAYSATCGSPITNCVVGTSTARTGSVSFQIFSDAPTNFALNLNGDASIGNSFDFGSTAKFYLRLPEGVSYTSSSGSFLTAAVPFTPPFAQVPEPKTYTLLLAALALMGIITRRRKTH